jgi:hypothetical protein
MAMEWYFWVLIIVGVVGLGALKMVIWNKMKANKKNTKQFKDED